VGGLTTLHPLVKLSLEMLKNPSAKELMEVVAVAGLAQNLPLYVHNHDGDSGRTYENAFKQHLEPV
jgi:hypothetical protein